MRVEDIAEGVVYEEAGVKITAFAVDHAPVRPAFGYRVDYEGRSVVLSGDTKSSENLVRHAKGVDLLIHEVASRSSLERAGLPAERIEKIVGHHTTPEQAGDIFSRTKPKLALYAHIVDPGATADELIAPTRKTYTGPLEIGEDLMTIVVSDEVKVQRPSR